MNQTKKEITQNPGRDDVHEQRDADQPREGVVEKQPGAADPKRTPEPTRKASRDPRSR
ncbi:MAG TPA: hypothetical protein VM925_13905 [Labilithrix sp.]|nr:hypothetical protein [Labilithrix sp.]